MLLCMALLTSLSSDAARRLLQDYGLTLARIEPMSEGSVNSNFRVWTDAGARYFARIYEEQKADGARAELRLVSELAAAGVPVATATPLLDGTSIHEGLGKPFALYPWIAGEILCQARVTETHVRIVGEKLAKLHLASSRVTPLGAGRFGPEQLDERLALVESQGDSTLRQAAGLVRRKLLDYQPQRRQLPEGVIHGDLFRDNVLWQDHDIRALIDFESASWGPFAYDLMVTLLAWCYTDRFEEQLVRGLLSQYHSTRRLGSAEFDALEVEGALGCLRFAATRMTDFSLRATSGSPPARDYRRFMQRLAALEAGVLASSIAELRAKPT